VAGEVFFGAHLTFRLPRTSARYKAVREETIKSSLGDLTVVTRDGAVTGLYFPHHWHMPDRGGFGPYREAGFDEIRKQLAEYLACERRDFDVPVEAAGRD
jgi:methylated-DNA-[protein]-cysteine S-methyltransferase